jgi:hypothetical protein
MSRTFRAPARRLGAATLALGVATSIILSAGNPASAATAAVTTTDPAQAAASWLAGRLVDNTGKPSPTGNRFEDVYGGTGYYSGTSLDAVFALAAAGVGTAKIAAILSYAATTAAGPYANLDASQDQTGPYDGAVAKLALAATVGGGDPRAFGGRDLIATLAADKCTAVTVGSYPSVPECPAIGAARNIYSSVQEAFVLLAQARAGVVAAAPELTFFLGLQCPDGGFTTNTSATPTCVSDLDATSYAMFALKALGGQSTALGKAATWLAGQRNAAGYWVSQGGPNTDSTGLATSALDLSGADVSVPRAWLRSQQVTDGPTFGPTASRSALQYLGTFDPAGSRKATADAIPGLIAGANLATLTVPANATAQLPVLPASGAVTHDRVVQGRSQTVSGTGFSVGETVTAVLHSAPVTVGTVTANATGTAALTFTVPKNTAAGAHQLVLTGAASGLSATVAFTVTAAAITPAPVIAPAVSDPQLAATGLDGHQLGRLSTLAGVLLLLGGGLLLVGRRRSA